MPTAQYPRAASAPSNKPVFEAKVGNIRASVWLSQSESFRRHQVTFSRSYKLESGWQKSTSFGQNDLPLLAKAADLAFNWMTLNPASNVEDKAS